MLEIKNKELWITKGDDGFLDLEVRQREFPYDIYKLEQGDEVYLTVRKSIKQNIDEEDNNPILIQIPLIDNKFHIKPEHTIDLDFGSYVYDVQLTLSNGIVNTIIGPYTFRITPEVNY